MSDLLDHEHHSSTESFVLAHSGLQIHFQEVVDRSSPPLERSRATSQPQPAHANAVGMKESDWDHDRLKSE